MQHFSVKPLSHIMSIRELMKTSKPRARSRECSILVTSLLVLVTLVAALSYNTHVEAQTTTVKQPNKQAQISNASSAKNTNATAAVTAPSIGNTQQLSKALENKTSLLKNNITQNKTNGTSNHKSTSSDEKTTIH
jgi:hypothetical protein